MAASRNSRSCLAGMYDPNTGRFYEEYEMQLIQMLNSMTNRKIKNILCNEFDIHESDCHEVELDIYIKLMRKCLRAWPRWEELQRVSSTWNESTDLEYAAFQLDQKYNELKEYLSSMLEIIRPLARKAIGLEPLTDPNDEGNTDPDIASKLLECTQAQLFHLIYGPPRPFQPYFKPTLQSLDPLTLEAILNCCWVKVYIHLPYFHYNREIAYNNKHALVARNRTDQPPVEIFDTRLQNLSNLKTRQYHKKMIYKYFNKTMELCKEEQVMEVLHIIFNILKSDLAEVPDRVRVPSTYRKYANQYKYFRYLFIDNMDMRLEESVAPCYEIELNKLGRFPDSIPPVKTWLKLECQMCGEKFHGSDKLTSLIPDHFKKVHENGPDYICTNCDKSFTLDYMAKNRWCHYCPMNSPGHSYV